MVIAFDRLRSGDFRIGDSICVQGCCLTAVELLDDAFTADVSRETLSLTTLGDLAVGSPVNLEPSLKAGDSRSSRIKISVPADLARYIARKGSVAVDGVSLTINEVEGSTFGVNIIPHTQTVTTLGKLVTGSRVNLEVDQVAR